MQLSNNRQQQQQQSPSQSTVAPSSLQLRQISSLDIAKSEADRILFLQGLLVCADMGNQCRHISIARKATLAVQSEFFGQGDRERDRKLPVSKFMDRNTSSDSEVGQSQMGYIDFLLGPVVDAASTLLRIDLRAKMEINNNRKFWEQVSKKELPFIGEKFKEYTCPGVDILSAIEHAFGPHITQEEAIP
ncbi:MAG: 3',5'-cyclic-nucleotide phosphodiesterase, partial [Streblomastix strix]